jgi:hypothetical protein
MKRTETARLLSLATLVALAACSGSGGDATGSATPSGDFLVAKTDPVNGASVFLNDPVSIDFTTPVDLDSATLGTMSFQALDQQGLPISELVTGNFSIGTSPGDTTAGRRLQFVPTLASNNEYSNGGFKPGRRYLVSLVGGTAANNTVLRDLRGKALAQPVTFQFATREGTQPAQIYRNPKSGGPARTGLSVTTADNLQAVPLGLFGAPPLEVRLDFDQALNPSDDNVPVNFDINPLVRNINDRGRVYLEYDDPVRGVDQWIPADVELERNDLTGATLVLRPAGVLPNNATVRIIVEASLEDISGESNLGAPAYNRVFGTFRTQSAYAQQWNGIVENFGPDSTYDPTAAFPEAQAEVGPGYLKAGFAFEGNSTTLEYEPTAQEVVLNTAFTQIVPKQGLPFTVSGGVFNFRNVTIPQGVTVIGTGPNPMVWLCNGKFTVSGTLTVRGGNGARVDTLNSANFAKAGGVAGPGGGNGGDGTPSATQRDLRGGTGRGPLQEAGRGGRGGYLACTAGCYTGSGYNSSGGGSGGGGGTMATQGDPNWRGTIPTTPLNPNVGPTANTAFQQRAGYGGTGCSGGSGTRTFPAGQPNFILPGGEPGDRVFRDTRADNDFWGSGIDVNRNIRIVGEISVPMGGGGGGGGGDTSPTASCSLTANDPANDYSGGGGGGGGGVLIVKALEEITITSSGFINANGGNGGGGEQVGSCGEAGGGGGGAGGMVVLMSAKSIIIETHGSTTTTPPRLLYGAPAGSPYQGNDYSFAIAADGGVCTTGGFGSVNLPNKYPASGTTMLAGSSYDGEPLGGLGGMGIVQLMVPPGENLTDGTNTRLDDNIIFRLPGSTIDINGVGKRHLLAWRGFPNASGTFVDDLNVPTNIGNNEGDIRPSPTLLPSPLSPKSRARSKWIDTGFAQRRELTAEDGLARGVVGDSGPTFEFAGLDFAGPQPGYIDYQALGNTGTRILYPTVLTPTAVSSVASGASYLGQPAYRITLANAVLGAANRYVQYEAELLNSAGSLLSSHRIVSHDDRELLCAVEGDLLATDATQVQIRAKFFKVVTNTAEGLGPVYNSLVNGSTVTTPIANLRFGFAFHRNPQAGLSGRFPANEQDFVRDLNDPALLAWINSPSNPDGPGVFPRYVMWDVVFDIAYRGNQTPQPQAPSLSPSTPRPELRFLRLPFKF